MARLFSSSGLCPSGEQGRLSSTARTMTHCEQGLPVSDSAMTFVHIPSWDLALLHHAAQLLCSEPVACLAVCLNRSTDVFGPECERRLPACLTIKQRCCCFVECSSCLLVCLQGRGLMVIRSHLLVRLLACSTASDLMARGQAVSSCTTHLSACRQ